MIKVNSREDFLHELKTMLPEKSIGAEIGVYRGDFSDMVLKIVQPRTIVLVDPYETGGEQYGEELGNMHTAYSNEDDYQYVLNRFKYEIGVRQVVMSRKYSYDIVDYVGEKTLDFIYNDASHLYKELKRDLVDWVSKLKYGGIMAGHDYLPFDKFGVIDAVNDFIAERGFEMVLFNINGGDWALKKKQ